MLLFNLHACCFAGTSQEIYRCFEGLRLVVEQAIVVDMQSLRDANTKYKFGDGIIGMAEFSTEYIRKALKETGSFAFLTVELLVKLLEMFDSQSTNTVSSYDTNVFLGPKETVKVDLKGMTLHEGWDAAEKFRHVLIHIDEVPMHDPLAPEPFFRCLLLRNLIRCIGLPCLLSGTESTLLDVVQSGKGSRGEGNAPWAWLLTSFPAVQLSEELTKLVGRCGAFESHMLWNTRPLFVQWFALCHEKGEAGTISLTPATLTRLKETMCLAKQLSPQSTTNTTDSYEYPWLHACTLLVFADSLQGSDDVTSTVDTDSTAQQVGAKRSAPPSEALESRKKKTADQINVFHHTLLIRKHFALLYVPPSLVAGNIMTKLHVPNNRGEVCYSSGKKFQALAAFKTCAEDPLLYLAGLRGGIVSRNYDSQRSSTCPFVAVPSSFAFRTFRQQTSMGNSLAKSNDGTALEAECIAALVFAAHRYTTFRGTPFFQWLAYVIAELNFEANFNDTTITAIPKELKAALNEVMVPLLSPANSPWGESMDSSINFGNLSWCRNQERRDASVPLSNTKAAGGTQGEEECDLEVDVGQFSFGNQNHGYTALGAEFKDVRGFGGKNMTAVTTKVAENSVCLLIGSDLSEWKKGTIQKFARDVSVYRMNSRSSIVRVSPKVTVKNWKVGRKVLIALDLEKLHPGRKAALPHAT